MIVTERELKIEKCKPGENLIQYLSLAVFEKIEENEVPVRFVITRTDENHFYCEVGVISESVGNRLENIESIFKLNQRSHENTNEFNVVLIIPTGVGCELGGHSGDGGAVARLFASISDNLVTHPNVVNAADINELPENGQYVEGSLLSRLMMGTITLQKVRSNRVLLILDEHEDQMFHELAINSASAARASLGLDCPLIIKMQNSILMRTQFTVSGRAAGRIERLDKLCHLLEEYSDKYDAVALSTLISVPNHYHADYFSNDKEMNVNPWGGVEAMLTHSLSSIYNVPTAHSPMMTSNEIMNLNVGIVDPRKSAEAVSTTYLHCILKGLHRSPRILKGTKSGAGLINVQDLSCLVIPDGCIGLPVLAAIEHGISVIAVKDRHCTMKNPLREFPFETNKLYFANNYLEAAGITSCIKAGVINEAVQRPLLNTNVKSETSNIIEAKLNSLRN